MAGDFIAITNAEVWHAVRDMQNLEPNSPLTRQVIENKEGIRGLNFRYYAILGAVTTGIVGSVVIRVLGTKA